MSSSSGGVAPSAIGALSATDALKWLSNFVSSVAIVMVNKQLMREEGCAFQFATTLCGLHFLCTMSVRLCTPRAGGVSGGVGKAASATAAVGGASGATTVGPASLALPRRKLFSFVAVASTSIISLNLSLMYNHVGFYQLAKLLQIPAVCVIEMIFLGRKVSWRMTRAIAVVMFGVGVATVRETSMNFWGTIVAIIAVLSTSVQQILVSQLQTEYAITSNELLARTAPLMAVAMLTVGPFMDQALTGDFVTDYYLTREALLFLSLSCSLAIWVNISQYMCIGTFSALSFQVIGHVKTVFIFFFGWLFFSIPVTWNNVIGGSIAIAGISYYSHIATSEKMKSEKEKLARRTSESRV